MTTPDQLRRSVESAIQGERRRCAGIARLAAQYAATDVVKHVAEAIAVAIENDAI